MQNKHVLILQTPAGIFMGVDVSLEHEPYALTYTVMVNSTEAGTTFMPYPIDASNMDLDGVEEIVTRFPESVCLSVTSVPSESSKHPIIQDFIEFWHPQKSTQDS